MKSRKKTRVKIKLRPKQKIISFRDLERKHRFIFELIDSIPDLIYFKDKKGKFVLVNKACASWLGRKPEDLIGKTYFDIFTPKQARLMTKDDSQVLKLGKQIVDKIERDIRPEGISTYLSTTKVPRRDDKGRIVGLMGISRDISYRIQFEHLKRENEQMERKIKSLAELSQLKSEFVAVISHELETPLAIAKETLGLISDQIAGPINKRQKELLQEIKGSMERLNLMIYDLLDMSRIEARKLTLHYSLVNLNDLFANFSGFFEKWAREKGIDFECNLPKEQMNIFVDTERINQVISNLVNNAIKFTNKNGKIRIEVKVFATKVRVGIIDTGIGIPRKELPGVFDKFRQLTRRHSQKEKGIGLGLFIVKELVDKHGGEIWAESKVGEGSRFYFTLPLFYTTKILGTGIRFKINNLLHQGKSVYLINLLIVNLKEFKKRIKVKPESLFRALKTAIETALGEFRKTGKGWPQIILEDYRFGEWSILFPEASQRDTTKLCVFIKDKIKAYFADRNIENIFINLGILAYSHKRQNMLTREFSTNLHIQNISIGPNTRRYKRINYKANFEISSSDDKVKSFQTMDISEGGICFISPETLETDANVDIALRLPKEKTAIVFKGRVVWIKNIDEPLGGLSKKYKIGLEFVDLENKKRRKLIKFIKAFSS
ncbi:MAG: ATP-binding protein [Omnitrophica bacterium]|nr:ATP-binding protein [Candidatus Omnitrophota bacterium]